MQTIFLPGKSVKASCERCGHFVNATYAYGAVEFDGMIVEDVMRATCDTCGDIVGTAGQSAYLFRQASDNRSSKRTSVRVPRELMDFVATRLSIVGLKPDLDLYLRAAILVCRGQESSVGNALVALENPVLHRPCSLSINVTFNPGLESVLEKLRKASAIQGVSELARRLIVFSAEDESFQLAIESQCETLGLVLA